MHPGAIARVAHPYAPALALGGTLLFVGLAGPDLSLALRYDRTALVHGEWWRLFAGHLVHMDHAHLALNLTGLMLVSALFARELGARAWLALLLLCALGTSLGLYVLDPGVAWYAGLSGVLHGLFVAGALARFRRDRPYGALLLALLAAKLLAEAMFGAGSETLVGGRVITEAHLYGALSGLAFLVLPLKLRARPAC